MVKTRMGLVAGAALLAFVLAFGVSVEPARANGTPIQLRLTWLEGVSNFGPHNAIATGEMITSEAELRLTTAGLAKLPDDQEYQVWISVAGTDRMRLVGFQVNDQGVARVDTVVPGGIPEKAWDLVVLTVGAKGSTPTAPGENRAIAGRFSMSNPTGVAVPKVLPDTGGSTGGNGAVGVPPTGVLGLGTGGIVLLGLLVVGVIGFALGRVGARRSA
jgi:hypothetical protein